MIALFSSFSSSHLPGIRAHADSSTGAIARPRRPFGLWVIVLRQPPDLQHVLQGVEGEVPYLCVCKFMYLMHSSDIGSDIGRKDICTGGNRPGPTRTDVSYVRQTHMVT